MSTKIEWVRNPDGTPGETWNPIGRFLSARDQCAAAGVPYFFKVDSNGNRELDGRLHEEMPR
jgi:protein gp37